MTSQEIQELAAAHAIGALSPEDSERLHSAIRDNPAAKAEVAAFLDATVLLARDCEQVRPPPTLRARILERIANTPAPSEVKPTPPNPAPEAFRFVLDADPGWVPGPIPGLRLKPLSVSRDMGYQVVLAELAPGAVFPEHDHASSEELFIISGHLQTEGRLLGPGDFLHAEPGTHHHPLFSPDGCVALLIERAPATA